MVVPALLFSLLYRGFWTLELAAAAAAAETAGGAPQKKPQSSSNTPATTNTKTRTTASSGQEPLGQGTSSSSSLFVVCSVDGSLYALDAWSGQFRSSSRTGAPLLTRSVPSPQPSADDDNVDDDEEYMTTSVIPGLDGKLYWQSPPNEEEGDDGEPTLQALPISIPSLLEHPVRSCTEDGQHCGILTAVAHTTLLALDTQTGDIEWSTGTTTSSGGATTAESTVLLQRKDFAIQQFSTTSGKELWNVTLGSYQAVDFEPPVAANHRQPESIDDDDDLSDDFIHESTSSESQNENSQGGGSSLPSLVFGNGGRELCAIHVHPQTKQHTVLWRVESPHVLTSVFGIHDNRWKAVHVLDDSEESLFQWNNDQHESGSGTIPFSRQLPSQAITTPTDFSQMWNRHHGTEHQQASQYQYNPMEAWRQVLTDQQRQQRRGAQKQLPGTTTEPATCWPGGECPNLPASGLVLGLPAPAPLSDANTASWSPEEYQRQQQQQQNRQQQFTSDHWIAMITCGFLLVWLGWWLAKSTNATTTTKSPLVAEVVPVPPPPIHNTTVSPFDMNGDNEEVRQTMSFPGAIRRKEQATGTDGSPVPLDLQAPPPVQSDPGETAIELSSPATPGTPSAAVATTAAGIPLVQYSRYASEFEELEALGRGGFGSVFRCRNNLDGRDYAIKKVSIRGMSDSTQSFQQELSRVLREVKILAVLDHPNIVRYYTAWLEMEEDDKDEGTKNAKSKNRSSQETSQSFGRSYNIHDSESTSSSIWQASSSNMTQDHSTSSWNGHGRNNKWSPQRSWKNQEQYQHNLPSDLDDCGIIFEDSTTAGDLVAGGNQPSEQISESRDSASSRDESAVDVTNTTATNALGKQSVRFDSTTTKTAPSSDTPTAKPIKHTLYIQMQLCRFDTVGDFLANKRARENTPANGSSSSSGSVVNMSLALGLLLQIAKAVQHVHEKGLIHRDLKPSNCFMDKSGVVKVGDFGLSRETSADQQSENAILASLLDGSMDGNSDGPVFDDDHTAGVGTRLYASPEQTEGSSYDASTDVYSLGIILFELCYPMYTGMERNICLSKLRQQRQFPSDWDAVVGSNGVAIQQLLLSMLEPCPSARPTALGVVQQMKELMGELTILSPTTLTNNNNTNNNLILLRVESTCDDNPLQHALHHIHEAAQPFGKVDILQSGMARENEVTVMEFAMQSSTVNGNQLVQHMQRISQMSMVREVSAHHHHTPDSDNSKADKAARSN